jgi:hypothetical protein
VEGGWRTVHNEELHNLYTAINSRKMRWEVHVAGMGETRSAYKILVGKPEG